MNRYWRTAKEVDRRMREAGLPYCVIKTYGANPDFNDSNIDVVTTAPLREVYEKAFSDHTISLKDEIKARFYEHNKLMAKPRTPDTSDIHLHSNAGWHDIEFVSGERIIENRIDHDVEGAKVQILEPSLDAEILVLQVGFENYKKKRWDNMCLGADDYARVARQYGMSESEIAPIREAELYIDLKHLRPIWKKYYAIRRHETRITVWNYFLHGLLWTLSQYRRRRASRLSAPPEPVR